MPPSEYTIREAEPEEWGAIAALLGRPPEAAAELRRWLQGEYEQYFAFLAIPPGAEAPAGACVAAIERSGSGSSGPSGPDDRRARIVWIGVAPAHRRRSAGTQLLDAALDDLRSRQVRRVGATLEGTDVEALALFRRAGFEQDGQQFGLVRPPDAPPIPQASQEAVIRPLALDEVPLLTGLLIRLGLERAEAIHDQLEVLTPSQVESWLQQPGTPAYAAWERDDPSTPLGLAWASRRRQDAVLRYIGVEEDSRRRGIGSALLAAILDAVSFTSASAAGAAPATSAAAVPLRVSLTDPADEAAFFRVRGFEVGRVTHHLSRNLS